jgi:hypothetical protein
MSAHGSHHGSHYPWYLTPYQWHFDVLPMVYRPPLSLVFWPTYPWYIDPPIHGNLDRWWMKKGSLSYGILTPMVNWLRGQFSSMVFCPPVWNFDPLISNQEIRSLFVLLSFFAIVLSVLWFTDSYYPFGILKLFLRKSFYLFPNRQDRVTQTPPKTWWTREW